MSETPSLVAAPAALSISEVAAALHVSRQTVWRYVRDGKLRAIRLGVGSGSTIRITPAALAQFVCDYKEEAA